MFFIFDDLIWKFFGALEHEIYRDTKLDFLKFLKILSH